MDAGPLSATLVAGGKSNLTYALTDGTHRWILRRPPLGHVLATAHDMAREYTVMSALEHTSVPVPRMYALCTDVDVLGAPFYLMEHVEGKIYRDVTELIALGPAAMRELTLSLVDTLADLHALDPAAIGLGDYGRAGNYFARQIGRWSKQYLQDTDAGRDANMDALVEWLPQNIPEDETTSIVHGDFRCDNMIFHPREPRVLAVLDWELSTLGDPLADFAYHLMMYRMPAGITAGLLGRDLAAEGIPTEDDYVAAYCRRTGRPGVPNLDFLVAFNMFRLAAILHGIKGRVARGTAASAHAAAAVGQLDGLAELAWAQAVRAGA